MNTQEKLRGGNAAPSLIKVITEVIAANSQKVFQVGLADHLFLQASTGGTTDLTFSFDDQAAAVFISGLVISSPNSFKTVQIANTSSGSITFTAIVSNGPIDYKALVIAGTINVIDAPVAALLTTVNTNWTTFLVNVTTILANWITELAQTLGIKNNTRSINGDTGTQIIKYGTANNSTTLIYTVSALKTLYISWFNVDAPGNVGATFEVTDASDTLVYTLCQLFGGVGLLSNMSQACPTPIKVPTGYKIKLISSAASACNATFGGWEE